MCKLQIFILIAIITNRKFLKIIVHRVIAIGIASRQNTHHTMRGIEQRRARRANLGCTTLPLLDIPKRIGIEQPVRSRPQSVSVNRYFFYIAIGMMNTNRTNRLSIRIIPTRIIDIEIVGNGATQFQQSEIEITVVIVLHCHNFSANNMIVKGIGRFVIKIKNAVLRLFVGINAMPRGQHVGQKRAIGRVQQHSGAESCSTNQDFAYRAPRVAPFGNRFIVGIYIAIVLIFSILLRQNIPKTMRHLHNIEKALKNSTIRLIIFNDNHIARD